ncbi:MAG: phage tail tape measure protein, partial [Psychroflexus sp.]
MSRFILTAQLRLQPPKNLNQVASQIQSRLNNVQANVQVNIPPKAQQQLAKTNKTLSKTSKSAESATNHITKFGEQAALAGKRFFAFTVATTAFLKLTRAISEGTSEAIDFQREMVRVSQVTDKTLGSLQDLSSEITNLSTSLGVQSKELLQSSRILSQAGLAADQVTTSLEALARADLSPTFGSMNDTTEASVAIFRQFGIEAQDLEKSLGSINAVASKFAVEAGDISTAVRRTGGAFSAAGGSLEELIALFTSVRATTRESAQSIATGFRTIFTRMQRESTQKFLESFGVTLRDLEGQFVGPLEAVRRLSTALDGLESTDPRFAKIVEQLGGFRQVSKVIPLIQQFATAEDALGVAIGGTNSLMEDSEKAQQSLAVQIQKTREEFSAMIRTLADTDSFRAVVTLTLGMADAFIKVTEALEPLMPLLTTFAAMKVGQMAPLLMKGFKGKGGLGFASGGLVPGSGNQDSVPARLTPGEFVIRKDSVNRIGLGNLQSLNGMAAGGKVAQDPLGVVFADPDSESRISSRVKPDNVEKSLKNLGLKLRDDQQVELDQGDYLEYNWITGRLDKDRSKLVKDTSKRAIESATLNVGKKINRQLPKDSQISKLRELDIIPNLDAMIGAIFEGTVMRLGAPFDTGQGDQSEHNRTLDFPNGLGGAGQKLFSNSALDGNIPVEAKKSLSTQSDLKGKNVRSNLRNKATNYVARNIFNSPDREFEGFRITTKSKRQGKPKPQARGGPAAPNAVLTPGEFVFDKSAAQQIGTSNLNKMNKTGTLPGFNRGGGFQMGGGMGQFASAGFAMAGVSALVSNFKGLNDTVDSLLSTLTSFGSQMGILVIALRSLNQGVTSRMIGSIQRTPPTSLLPSTVQQQQNLGTLVPQLQSGQKQITTITKL